jgi:hypothetical protein
VREAHADDGWWPQAAGQTTCHVKQPRTLEERFDVARLSCQTLQVRMPVLVDTIDDRVGHAYSGMPDRLYVIDAAGRVAFKSGRGPFGFRPLEMEQSLLMLLLDEDERQGPRRQPDAR